MNKTYISSLLVVLMAGAQAVWAQAADLDALLAESETEAASPAEVDMGTVGANLMQSNEDVATMLSMGEELYRLGKYQEAQLFFESVLSEDVYNRKAMDFLSRIAVKLEASEARLYAAARALSMAEVEVSWIPRYENVVGDLIERPEPSKTEEQKKIEEMTNHLKGMLMPTLDFRDATIKDVVLFLTETCRRMDSTGKGINFILLGLDNSDAMGAMTGNDITISIRDLSLYDALQVIVEMASLRFEVEPNMVVIMPANYVRSVDLMMETYTVIPEVGEELSSMAGGGDSGDTMDDLFGGGSSSASTDSGPVDVSGYFSIVTWPEQSSAMYYPTFKKLIVKNTKENIRKVKTLVDELEEKAINDRSSQVQIEAKFVEFSEGSLKELGFDWNIYGSGSVAGFEFDQSTPTYTPISGYMSKNNVTYAVSGGAPQVASLNAAAGTLTDSEQSVFDIPLHGVEAVAEGGESLFGGNQRSHKAAFETVTSGILSRMGGVPAAMMFSDGTVDLRITAMEQEGTADVLSAPKITTQSGYEAVIRVTEIHRYPQDWDVETGQRTAPVVKPQDWEDFDLGVVLRVTPEVDTENNTIKLELNPEIRKLLGFDAYHVADNAYDAGTTTGESIRGDGSELFAEMAFFETRSVQTRVTVADGSTVMMGGLVDERTETFRDQVPILGDIPYIGRLFRSEGSRTAKKNLVIFVKATQVDEHGMTRVERELARKVVSE